jgi:hypothetical protein
VVRATALGPVPLVVTVLLNQAAPGIVYSIQNGSILRAGLVWICDTVVLTAKRANSKVRPCCAAAEPLYGIWYKVATMRERPSKQTETVAGKEPEGSEEGCSPGVDNVFVRFL